MIFPVNIFLKVFFKRVKKINSFKKLPNKQNKIHMSKLFQHLNTKNNPILLNEGESETTSLLKAQQTPFN